VVSAADRKTTRV